MIHTTASLIQYTDENLFERKPGHWPLKIQARTQGKGLRGVGGGVGGKLRGGEGAEKRRVQPRGDAGNLQDVRKSDGRARTHSFSDTLGMCCLCQRASYLAKRKQLFYSFQSYRTGRCDV